MATTEEKTMALAELTSYLKQKLAKTNMNNSKSHTGAVIVLASEGWQEKLPQTVETSVFLLYSCLTRAANTPAGMCRLVSALSLMGKVACNTFGHTDPNFQAEMRVGALYIEAFYQCGYIDIFRDNGFSKYDKTAPYIVEATHKWSDLHQIDYSDASLYRGTSPEPRRVVPDSLVKRCDSTIAAEVAMRKEKPFFTATEYLNRVGWKVNVDIHRIIRDNMELFANPHIRVFDIDGKEYLYDVTLEEQSFDIENLVDINGNAFSPHLGNKRAVDDAFDEYAKLEKKTRSRKRISKKLAEDIEVAKAAFNEASLYWGAKLAVLKKRSKLFDLNMTMKKAGNLLDETAFYQSGELDWRSRYYSAEPFFNFQGSDIARGQMLFAEGKPIGEEGLFWLAAHTAACFNKSFSKDELPTLEWTEMDYIAHLENEGLDSISLDKMALGDRVNWTMHNREYLMDLADREALPETIEEAEKPVSALACCIELRNIFESDDPAGYITYLPIPVDGSNNGSQHYAAISRDEDAADFTGLMAKDIPVDYYLRVAKGMIAERQEYFDERKMPLKHIRKGISKRSAMVRIYSSGAKKISENMYADVYKEGFDTKYNISMLDCIDLGKVAVKVIDGTNKGAAEVMSYLQKLASYELGKFGTFDKYNKRVDPKDLKELRFAIYDLTKSKSTEDREKLVILEDELQSYEARLVEGNGAEYLSWETPAGFPVKYASYLTKKVSCFVSIKGVGRLNIAGVMNTERPDTKAFMSGISPNYIHSHDAAHMFLALNECEKRGVYSIGAVHDSFSTHACDVPVLIECLKETFIEMYKDPDYLANMRYNLLSKNIEEFDGNIPEPGDLDLSGVIESDYFFS